MDDILLQFFREIDDLDCVEGTFVDTDPASDAQYLADGGKSLLSQDDGLITHSHPGAEIVAFVRTFLWLASVFQQNSDPHDSHKP